MSYFEKENEARAVPTFEEEMVPQGETYRCMFIEAGAVGYKDGLYFLSQGALDEFAYTLKRKPVVIGHQDIEDMSDMKDKAVGMVVAVDRCPETGRWYCDFCIWDKKAMDKINGGDLPFVSCAYRADLTSENCDINNVKYKKRIVGGEMLHLALVKNPRYNGTEIWRNAAEDYFVGDGVIYNQKENVMFGFKKTKAEIDKDILVNTKLGEKTIEDLVNELEAAHDKMAEQETKITDLEKRLAEAQPEPATVEPEPQVEVQPVAETKPAEAPADADLKKDLNNALTEDVKAEVVAVPNIK